MAVQRRRRRGTAAQHATFTGAGGELTVDTSENVVVVHDGSTSGGFHLARRDRTVPSFATRAALEAASVPVSINRVAIRGYTAESDGGGAEYKRVSSEPSHVGKIQSADGAWWEIDDLVLSAGMFASLSDARTTAGDEKLVLDGERGYIPQWTVGTAADNLGVGLQIGGGDNRFSEHGTVVNCDGHPAWLRVQPSQNESPVELLIYPTGAQGRASKVSGTNQFTRETGTAFSSSWVGRRFYHGRERFLIATVTDADTLTVTTLAGGAVTHGDNAEASYHVAVVQGNGTCSVSGTTVTRLTGDPFIPFTQAPFRLLIDGTEREVSSFTDIDTLVLSSAPGNTTSTTFYYETIVDDTLVYLRLQKTLGSTEENLSIGARADGRYFIRAQIAGDGDYYPLYIGSGESSPGQLREQIVVHENGDVLLGADYESEVLRILAPSNAATNRFEMSASATGSTPSLRARGVDTNVGIGISTKGSGAVTFTSAEFTTIEFQIFAGGGTSWLSVESDGFAAPTLAANGAAADIDIKLAPKGTGVVWLGAPYAANTTETLVGHIIVKDESGTSRKIGVVA